MRNLCGRVGATAAVTTAVVVVAAVVGGATVAPAAAVAGTAGLGAAGSVGARVAGAPEADLAFHGRLWMDGGQVELRMTPQNHGPFGVADATVRLRWSAPLADEQRLPRLRTVGRADRAVPDGCAARGRLGADAHHGGTAEG